MTDEEWWSFDTHLCGYVADAVERFQREGITDWELSLPGVSLMDDIVLPLRAWANHFDCEDLTQEAEAHEAAKKAFHLFVDNLGTWWD